MWSAPRQGFVAVAIDGPGHGERLPPGQEPDFLGAWKRPETTDETVADWKATLDAVQILTGDTNVGYFGISMGTMMGLPLITAEPRIGAALLGLMGTVTGMIAVFDVMAISGSGNARGMAAGVSKATLPTMAGMVAALSGLYFSRLIDRFTVSESGRVGDSLIRH